MENTLSSLLTDEDSSLFSSMERKVLKEYLAGKKYPEIAQSLGKSYKVVDNAMQRIRRKINEYINNKNNINKYESQKGIRGSRFRVFGAAV